jgi:hypothetical protein
VTTLHDFEGVFGRPLDTFLLNSHNFMVTALGSSMKWPCVTMCSFSSIPLSYFEGQRNEGCTLSNVMYSYVA